MLCDMFDVLLDFEQDDVLEDFSKFSLDLCNRSDNLVALRTDENAPMTTRYTPVRLCELLTLRAREFSEILKGQRERLLFSFNNSEITQIEDEFNALKRACTLGIYPSEVDQKLFDDSSKPYGDRYSKSLRFHDGIATVFPGTSRVESNFFYSVTKKHQSGIKFLSFLKQGKCTSSNGIKCVNFN